MILEHNIGDTVYVVQIGNWRQVPPKIEGFGYGYSRIENQSPGNFLTHVAACFGVGKKCITSYRVTAKEILYYDGADNIDKCYNTQEEADQVLRTEVARMLHEIETAVLGNGRR